MSIHEINYKRKNKFLILLICQIFITIKWIIVTAQIQSTSKKKKTIKRRCIVIFYLTNVDDNKWLIFRIDMYLVNVKFENSLVRKSWCWWWRRCLALHCISPEIQLLLNINFMKQHMCSNTIWYFKINFFIYF